MLLKDLAVEIATRNRYESLLLLMQSLVFQSAHPAKIFIFDDSVPIADLRTNQNFFYIFTLLDRLGVKVLMRPGAHNGPAGNHEMALRLLEEKFIMRVDDDSVLEYHCLEELYKVMQRDRVGAAAPVIRNPRWPETPGEDRYLRNKMENWGKEGDANSQWFNWPISMKPVYGQEHLHSSFMYLRKAGIDCGGYCTMISQTGYTEETIFSHKIYRDGYECCMVPAARMWHYQQMSGGGRDGLTPEAQKKLHDKDAALFEHYLELCALYKDAKIIPLMHGIGDILVFLSVLRKIRDRWPQAVFTISRPKEFKELLEADFPEFKFIDYGDYMLFRGVRPEDTVYNWMKDNNWSGSLEQAYLTMYGVL